MHGKHRSVAFITTPVHSAWNLPIASPMLSSVLLANGHTVEQIFSHIEGVEYTLLRQDSGAIGNALATIRNANSNILSLYDARMTLERVSRQVPTPDKFVVERNNITYVSSFFDGSIHSVLRAITNRHLNPFYHYIYEVLIPRLKQMRPDMCCVSISDERGITTGFTIAAAIKEEIPGAMVAVGGNFFGRVIESFELPEVVDIFQFCDCIVYGEGFLPIQVLADTLDPRQAPSTVWLDGDKVVVNPRLSQPVEFQSLPTPVFDNKVRQWSPYPVYPLYTMSNCPGNCSFCGISASSDTFERPPRMMSERQVAEHMAKIGGHMFDIQDEMMCVERNLRLGKELKNLGHKAIWQCYMGAEPRLANPDVCHALYNAGCRAVQIGLESLSPAVLHQEGKTWNQPSLYEKYLHNLWEAGIQTHIFIMVGAFGEPLHWSLKWLPFLKDHDKFVSMKSGRGRLSRGSRDHRLGNPFIEVDEEECRKKPWRLNLVKFEYKPLDTGRRTRRGEPIMASISHKQVDAVRQLLEAASRNHWGYAVTSTIPWAINRMRFTLGELQEMATHLPPEPLSLEEDVYAKIATIIHNELLRSDTIEDVLELARILP